MIDDLFDPNAAWFQFVGRLHVVLLHLPIGLWVGVAFLEFGSALLRRQASRATVATLAWFATFCAAVAVGTGWMKAMHGDYDHALVDKHRWLGVAFASIGLLAAALAGLRGRGPFRLLLVFVLGVMVAAGHLGGSLTHGETFLTDNLGTADVGKAGPPDAGPPSAGTPDAGPPNAWPPNAGTPDPVAATFASAVQPILERTCVQCHGPEKHKADLLLTDAEGIRQGGEDGPVIAAGDPEQSPLYTRIALPLEHKDHMPKKGKPQPTAAEIATLRAWIAAGAPFEGAFALDAAKAGAKADPPKTDPSKADAPKNNAPVPVVEPKPQADPPANKEPAKPDGSKADTPAADAPKTDEPKTGAPKTGAPNPKALAALQQANVHVQQPPPGGTGLQIDFAPCAVAMTEAEAKTLLTPLVEQIADLGLARVPVDDGICALCAKMPLLERLDLRNTAVTSKGVQQLQALPKLKELVLAQTKLDDAAVDPLLAMPALTKVYVWNAGLSADGLARLRGKQGLVVDAGDAPPAKALETEGDLKFANELPAPGQKAPPPEVAAALRPVNDVCPVSGKPVDPRFVIVHDGKAIGFCCPNCPKEFWTEPSKFAVKER